jgi:hypothetical protein
MRKELLERVLEDLERQGEEAKAAARANYTSRYTAVQQAQIAKEESLRKADEQTEERVQALLKEDRHCMETQRKHRSEIYERRAAQCAATQEALLIKNFERGLEEERRREERLSARCRQLAEYVRSASASARRRQEHQQAVLEESQRREQKQLQEKAEAFAKHRQQAAERMARIAEARARATQAHQRTAEEKVRSGLVAKVKTIRSGDNKHVTLTVDDDGFEKRRLRQEAAEAEAALRVAEARKDRLAFADFQAKRRREHEETIAARMETLSSRRLESHEKIAAAIQSHDSAVQALQTKRREQCEASGKQLLTTVVDHLNKAEDRLREKLTSTRHANFERWSQRTDQLVAQTLQQYADFTKAAAAAPRGSIADPS